jgi:hypothetical protein
MIHWTSVAAAGVTIAASWAAALSHALPYRYAAIASAVSAGLLATGQGLHAIGAGAAQAPAPVSPVVHVLTPAAAPQRAAGEPGGAV